MKIFTSINKQLSTALLLFGATVFSSCKVTTEDNYKMQYVVESYLAGDEAFSEVYVTKTLPLFDEFTLDKAGVNSALVTIFELNDSQNRIDSITFSKDVYTPGLYVPNDTTLRVKPETMYELVVYITEDNNHKLTGTTLVPGAFSSASANADTVMYQSGEQFEVTYTSSFYPNRQSYYILTVFAQDTTRDLTPFYAEISKDGEPTRTDHQRHVSNILTEANFVTDAQGNVTISLPWFVIAFYGPHNIIAHTIDNNVYDFNRTQETQFGGATVSPGEIYDVIDHIEGGTGIFGSFYRQTSTVYISRNPLIDFLFPTN